MYVIAAVPGLMPFTTPIELTTVATDVFPLVHIPPAMLFASVVLENKQTFKDPVIGGRAANAKNGKNKYNNKGANLRYKNRSISLNA